MGPVQRYQDRRAAGMALAELLGRLSLPAATVVLSLPRGGTVVAAEIARNLGLEHDLVVSRKIGAPGNPEVAIAALAQDGRIFKNQSLINALRVSEDYLQQGFAGELEEIKRRFRELRGSRPFPELQNKTVILVDDGVATGSTLEAAIGFVKTKKVSQILIAVPVGPTKELDRLEQLVDQVICPLERDDFLAVGEFYEDFHQVSDAEVREALGIEKGDSSQ